MIKDFCKLLPEKKREVCHRLPLKWKLFLDEKTSKKDLAPLPIPPDDYDAKDNVMFAKGGSSQGKWSLASIFNELYQLIFEKLLILGRKTAPKNPSLEAHLAVRKAEMAKVKEFVSSAEVVSKLPPAPKGANQDKVKGRLLA